MSDNAVISVLFGVVAVVMVMFFIMVSISTYHKEKTKRYTMELEALDCVVQP